MDYFKVKNTDLKKKRSEEEVKKSLLEHVEKEYPEYVVTSWTWDEELHEGILQMQSR